MVRPAHWDAMRATGLVLTLVGFGLLTVARVQLGNSFSVTPQARALVTTGVYRKIRNPVYVFSAIGIAGFVLYVGRPMWLLLLLALLPMQVLRAAGRGKDTRGSVRRGISRVETADVVLRSTALDSPFI